MDPTDSRGTSKGTMLEFKKCKNKPTANLVSSGPEYAHDLNRHDVKAQKQTHLM
jgi:hypothetical protein